MAKRNRTTTERSIQRRLKEGRGQGTGSSYKPWITIQDVPSQGLTHRIMGWTTGRIHHLLSNLERDTFYIMDWGDCVLDIREQYPLLPLEETCSIAEQIGVKHPVDPTTRHATVMTTDFVLDIQNEREIVQQARTVKPASQLEKPRTLEKLEIERRYWNVRNVDWGIITEHEILRPQSGNIRLLHGYRQIEDRLPSEFNLSAVCQFLFDYPLPTCIKDITKDCEQKLGLVPGTALTILYHLLATRQMAFNMSEKLTAHAVLPTQQVVS